MIGTVINNRYRLDAELGRGGMGMVYRGHDLILERPVAVKVLTEGGLGSEGRGRLLHEARLAAKLNHPNVVGIYDAGLAGTTPFVVMELVEGESLHDRPPENLGAVLDIARQICIALEHAHEHQIVHRDLKPENVLITNEGQVKLTDFGLALSLASRLTSEGSIIGTVYYLAPEMALAQPFDGRADLYSLGVILYELTTGRVPFEGDNPLAVVSQHVHAPVVPPSTYRPDLLPELEALILRLMSKDPTARYNNARAVAQALDALDLPRSDVQTADAGGESDERQLLEKLGRGKLIGRKEELAGLRRLWKRALNGQASLALISGEPGVGKTRLANELVIYARLSGAVVLRGGSYEYEAGTPYLPFVEALREWVRQQPAESLNRLEDLAAELSKLAPEIESRLGPLTPNPPLPGGEERLRLYDHIARFMALISAPKGLLLFIDDIHWADAGTLSLVQYLLRHLKDDRLMVMACYREVELDRLHPFATALIEWNRAHLATRISLDRLSKEDVRSMLKALFGQQNISDEFTEAIDKETEGNPFFIEEVIKSLIEQGGIYRENGRWQRRELSDLAIPQSVKEVIGRRLDRQSATCIEMLHTAAALGKRFVFSELHAASELGESVLLDALDEASRAQLIRAEEGEIFTFTHDKIREVLYEELNPIRRRRLHLNIANGLENLYHPDGLRPVSSKASICCGLSPIQALAHHFVAANDLERGLHYSIRAAENAEAVFAHEDALQYARHALDCAEALERNEEQARVLQLIGAVHVNRGSFQLAADAYERALALTGDFELKNRLKIDLGTTYAHVGDRRGLPYLEDVRQALDPEKNPLELARVHALLGRFHHLNAEWKHAIRHLERALSLAEPLNDSQVLSEINAYLSGVYQWTGDIRVSLDWARKNIELGERTGNPFAVALGNEFFAEAYFSMDRWKEALAYADEDRKIGIKLGSQTRIAWAENAFAHCYHGLGDLERALHAANETVRIVEDTGEERLETLIRSKRAEILADLGRFEAAYQDVEYVQSRAKTSGHRQDLFWSYRACIHLYLVQEKWDELRKLLHSAPQEIRMANAGEALIAAMMLDDGEEVGELEKFVVQDHYPAGSEDYSPWYWLLLAMLADYHQDSELAARYYTKAVDEFDERGGRLGSGIALRRRAGFLAAAGRLNEASEDAARSFEILEAIGAKPEQAKSEVIVDLIRSIQAGRS